MLGCRGVRWQKRERMWTVREAVEKVKEGGNSKQREKVSKKKGWHRERGWL